MKNWIKENKVMAGVIVFVLAAIIFAVTQFLFTKSGDYEGAITGVQALQQQTTEFWLNAIGWSVASGVALYFAVKKIKKMAGFGVPLTVLVPAIIFIAIAWGKGCTDKANDGVTSGKGRPVPAKVDSLRVPAEDLLPK